MHHQIISFFRIPVYECDDVINFIIYHQSVSPIYSVMAYRRREQERQVENFGHIENK